MVPPLPQGASGNVRVGWDAHRESKGHIPILTLFYFLPQTIVSLQGQKFLLRDSDVVMAEAEVSDTDDVTDLSRKPPSSVSRTEIYPENSQKVLQKLEDVPGIDKMSRGQVSVML